MFGKCECIYVHEADDATAFYFESNIFYFCHTVTNVYLEESVFVSAVSHGVTQPLLTPKL